MAYTAMTEEVESLQEIMSRISLRADGAIDRDISHAELIEILEASGFGHCVEFVTPNKYDFGAASKEVERACKIIAERTASGVAAGMTILGTYGVGKTTALVYGAYSALKAESENIDRYQLRGIARFVTADVLASLGINSYNKYEELSFVKHLFLDDLMDMVPSKKELIRSLFNERERRGLSIYVSSTMTFEELTATYPLVYDRMKFYPLINCYRLEMKSRRKLKA